MDTLIDIMRGQLSSAIKSAFEDKLEKLPEADVSACKEEFGHYQCNSPLRLSKELRMNPRMVAEELIKHIKERDSYSKIEVAGPGFINFTFSGDCRIQEIRC